MKMTVTLIENFRAVFYIPYYASLALGAYRAEGVEVVVKMSTGADRTLKALLSGEGDVSWGGPLRVMIALDREPGAGLAAFCEVVGRDPFFLVGHTPKPSFRLADLQGATLATTSEVPTPWLCLQHDLRGAGIEPAAIQRAPARTMAENADSLRAGEVDAIQVFQPYARQLVDEGSGHVWYAAAARGPAAYTTFNATRRFIEQHPDTVLRMTRAMYRTQKWVAAHDGIELARLVVSFFPDIPLATLSACCNDYKSLGLWNRDPIMRRAGLLWLRDAALAGGLIRTRFEFEDCADMQFAEQVIKEDPPALA